MPEKPPTHTYLLRDIPADLWTQARHAAIDRRISLRELLLDALRRSLEHGHG